MGEVGESDEGENTKQNKQIKIIFLKKKKKPRSSDTALFFEGQIHLHQLNDLHRKGKRTEKRF